ncbi:blarina toxin-like [Suncus etruscus]|uniref:blarina toxin-like n=1 Tax=Suncus etruscus TaxID=109475 RepID=UPI00210FF787|nr:blarina toxin-like [Suncus etruscus]
MWLLTLGLALTLAMIDAAPHHPGIQINPRIIGGWGCEENSRPWQAALHYRGRHNCGGVLVHPQWVLTAAHCISPEYEVWLGLHNRILDKHTAQLAEVSASFPHPLYNMTLQNLIANSNLNWTEFVNTFRGSDFSHDLMLLRLKKPVQLTQSVQVLHLPTREPQVGSSCSVSGWGSIIPDSITIPATLQCLNVRLLPKDICSQGHIYKVTEFMLCAGQLNGGQDSCTGDSGGPLICDGMFQGTTSWGGTPCAEPGEPGLYVKVFTYVNWILETIEANS